MNKLTAYRQAVGLSVRALAIRAGIQPSTLGRIERGEVVASGETARKLHLATEGKVALDDIIGARLE